MEAKKISDSTSPEILLSPEDQRLLVDVFGILLEWAIEDGKNNERKDQKIGSVNDK